MRNEDKLFAQNWIEQYRANVDANASSEVFDILETCGCYSWPSVIALGFDWDDTPEYRVNERLWVERYSHVLEKLMR